MKVPEQDGGLGSGGLNAFCKPRYYFALEKAGSPEMNSDLPVLDVFVESRLYPHNFSVEMHRGGVAPRLQQQHHPVALFQRPFCVELCAAIGDVDQFAHVPDAPQKEEILFVEHKTKLFLDAGIFAPFAFAQMAGIHGNFFEKGEFISLCDRNPFYSGTFILLQTSNY
jgi:hypothetical protein